MLAKGTADWRRRRRSPPMARYSAYSACVLHEVKLPDALQPKSHGDGRPRPSQCTRLAAKTPPF
jgi:hypothetical protein